MLSQSAYPMDYLFCLACNSRHPHRASCLSNPWEQYHLHSDSTDRGSTWLVSSPHAELPDCWHSSESPWCVKTLRPFDDSTDTTSELPVVNWECQLIRADKLNKEQRGGFFSVANRVLKRRKSNPTTFISIISNTFITFPIKHTNTTLITCYVYYVYESFSYKV